MSPDGDDGRDGDAAGGDDGRDGHAVDDGGADVDDAHGGSDDGSPPRPRWAVHVGLFAVTCATTVWAGTLASGGSIAAGASFGGALMLILLCHEMGHYVVARRYGLPVSPPYFVPLPPQISLGTLGAVIRMQRPISDRNQLIDVGAAGPLAGLAVALPLMVWGLAHSPIEPIPSGAYLEGNSILYIGVKYAVTGRYLPSGGVDVTLHPVAFAAWVGLLITMINLIPIGQLDGGHVACAYLGDRHERSSRWLHRGLLAVGVVVTAALAAEAGAAGRGLGGALAHGARGGVPWLVWAGILVVMRGMGGGMYHPPVSGPPLTRGRRLLVAGMALLFALIFTPVPLRPAL